MKAFLKSVGILAVLAAAAPSAADASDVRVTIYGTYGRERPPGTYIAEGQTICIPNAEAPTSLTCGTFEVYEERDSGIVCDVGACSRMLLRLRPTHQMVPVPGYGWTPR